MLMLSQTIAGSWVITVPNPEERHWSTQLAEFDTTCVTAGTSTADAFEQGAVTTLALLVKDAAGRDVDDDFTNRVRDTYQVTSHDPAAVARMEGFVETALATLRGAA